MTALLSAALLSLGACALPSDVTLNSGVIKCPKISEKVLKMVNWIQVPEVVREHLLCASCADVR